MTGVYFVQHGDLIKVGYSRPRPVDPKSAVWLPVPVPRLSHLSSGLLSRGTRLSPVTPVTERENEQ